MDSTASSEGRAPSPSSSVRSSGWGADPISLSEHKTVPRIPLTHSWAMPPLAQPPPLLFPHAPSFLRPRRVTTGESRESPRHVIPTDSSASTTTSAALRRANEVVDEWVSGKHQLHVLQRLEANLQRRRRRLASVPGRPAHHPANAATQDQVPDLHAQAWSQTEVASRVSTRKNRSSSTTRSPTRQRVHQNVHKMESELLYEVEQHRGVRRWVMAHNASLHEQYKIRQQEWEAFVLQKVREKHDHKLQMEREEAMRKRLERQHKESAQRLSERLKQAARGNRGIGPGKKGLQNPWIVANSTFALPQHEFDIPGSKCL